ncbi:MAG: hypothetical protein WAU28_04120 [Candidatus Moraniibacteriota bacterium]
MAEEFASMRALLMDYAAEFTKMRSAMQRLTNRVYELEKAKRDIPSTTRIATVPSDSPCEKTDGDVILYGKKIPLHRDVADVLYQLACQEGFISKEHLATLCRPHNKLCKGEHIQPGTVYQRLNRLKFALNAYHASLGECIVSERQSTKGTPLCYSFDAKKFCTILGIK